jgi:hypothetical protein
VVGNEVFIDRAEPTGEDTFGDGGVRVRDRLTSEVDVEGRKRRSMEEEG